MNYILESYSFEQWILLFFIYGFFGYIWEVCYVSLRRHSLTDRGFFYGPILPIYGSGALIILFATIPVKSSIILVFICGMCAATLLEFITGWAMEKIFKVRYWDYHDNFLNIAGYICPKASLAWGVFSVLLIYFIHNYIERLLFLIPNIFITPCAFALTVVFCIDATLSVRAALDLKEVLQNIAANNEELRRLQKRLDIVAAFIDEDKENFKEFIADGLENISDKLEDLEDKLEDLGEKVEDYKEETAFIRSQRKTVRRQNIAQAKADYRLHFEQLVETLKAQEKYFSEHTKDSDDKATERANKRNELSAIHIALAEYATKRRTEHIQRNYRHAQSILKRNHSAISPKYSEALAELRRYKEPKSK